MLLSIIPRQAALTECQDLEAGDGNHDRKRVFRAASRGTLPHFHGEGAAGMFGAGGDRLPSTQESNGRPQTRKATPPFNLRLVET